MKALLFQGVGKLSLAEVEMPRPGRGELLVRTGASVICTSDVNELHTGIFGAHLPVIFGHEGAGTVAAVGDGVVDFSIGDRVAAHPVHSCGQCDNCRAGMSHLCARMRHFGLNMPGTFAEYFIVSADRARKMPQTVPHTAAAQAEPVSVCLQAIAQARVNTQSSLLITGDGPFGILMSMLARSMGLKRIVMAGEHDFRLGFSAANETINVRTVSVETLDKRKSESSGGGVSGFEGGPFDAVILATGNGIAVRQALSLLRPKGRLVIFSAVNDPTPIDLLSVHIRELEIVGSCNDEDRLDDAVRRIAESPEQFDRIVTHRFPLDRYEEAFALASSGHDRALKVAFTFENT